MSNATFPSLGWEGFLPDLVTVLSPSECLIVLVANPAIPAHCNHCHRPCKLIHDTALRRIRDRDLFEYRVWLDVPLRRVHCDTCGVAREAVSWLSARARMTDRLRRQVELFCTLLPLKHIAQLTGLHWHTIKAIDKARLQRDLPPPDLSQVRRLMMDEFALFKGHRYATVVADADTQQVLWVGEGHSRADIAPFFVWLGPAACARIEAVAMDMNTAYDLEVQLHCPQARVVYDLFHVIAKFGREVVDRVRVDQANQLRHDKPARQVIKRSRWLLLRNKQNLEVEQRVKLDELLAANQPLMTVYLLKDQLKELWYAPSEAEAQARWQAWIALAIESGLAPVQQFARRLKTYVHGIIASAVYRMSTSALEGMNNRIKVIKRMAYGYRDNEYFFLKIKAAFPGKAR